MQRMMWLTMMAVLACGEKEEETTPPDLVNGDETETGCGGTSSDSGKHQL